jgi:hypothetical protein
MSTETPENLQITSVEEIKKQANKVIKEGIVIELPSGIKVKLRRPSLANLLKSGKIPSNLTQAALRQAEGRPILSQKDVEDSLAVVEVVLQEAFVEPKLKRTGEETGPNEINITDLVDEDRGFVFQYVQNGSADLKPFRNK